MTDPRDRQLAELLVDTCVGVQPGWQVLVGGTPAARPLLEEIVRRVAELDAYALLRVTFDANIAPRTWLRTAPLERIGVPAPIEVHALETSDALIVIDAPENTRDAASVDTERTAAIQTAYRPAFERMFRHELQWVGCQYPTPALAQDAGMGTREFADFLYGACLLDWDAERKRMQRYADRFDAAVQDAKRNPAGTIQALEDKLNEAFGLEEGGPFSVDLSLATEDRGTADTSDDHKMLRVDLTLGAGFAESLGIDFDLGDAGFLTGAAELSASGDLKVELDFGIDLTSTDMRDAGELTIDAAAGTITRAAGSWLADGFKVRQSIAIGAPEDAGSANTGDFEIAEVTGAVLTLAGPLAADEARSDLTVTGSRSVSLFETTGLSGRFLASASDINFRAAVGPLGLFVSEGSVAIGGDVPPL